MGACMHIFVCIYQSISVDFLFLGELGGLFYFVSFANGTWEGELSQATYRGNRARSVAKSWIEEEVDL